jgi:hypothetical protein
VRHASCLPLAALLTGRRAVAAGPTGIQLPDTGCGDLTGALNLERSRRDADIPKAPYNYLLNQYVNSQDQNNPVVPTSQTLPTQEPGSRPPTPHH